MTTETAQLNDIGPDPANATILLFIKIDKKGKRVEIQVFYSFSLLLKKAFLLLVLA